MAVSSSMLIDWQIETNTVELTEIDSALHFYQQVLWDITIFRLDMNMYIYVINIQHTVIILSSTTSLG